MYGRESLAGAGNAGIGVGPLRPLALALLASLVLHVLVLYALPALKESMRAPARPLTARLAKLVAPEPAKVEPLPQRPLQPSPSRPAPVPKAAPQVAVPAPVPMAPVRSVEPAQRAQAAEPALALPAAPPSPAPQAPVARADTAPASTSAPGATGPDPGSIARYRLELMEIAPRYKRYPRIALDNNWEGRTELRIAVAESGAIASLTVKKGAGRVALDDAAQSMIRSAQAQVVIPPALRGKAFTLDVAVDFILREEK